MLSQDREGPVKQVQGLADNPGPMVTLAPQQYDGLAALAFFQMGQGLDDNTLGPLSPPLPQLDQDDGQPAGL